MQSEATPAESAALPPRAGVALLTLQLRACEQEADAAEADAATDAAAARDQLRARLEQLMDERRAQLDAELATAHADAASRIEAATRAAAVMVARAAPVASVQARTAAPATKKSARTKGAATKSKGAPPSTRETATSKSPKPQIAVTDPTTGPVEVITPDAVTTDAGVHAGTMGPAEQAALSLTEAVAQFQAVARSVERTAAHIAEMVSPNSVIAPPPADGTVTTRVPLLQPAPPQSAPPAALVPAVAQVANVVIDAEAFARVFATVLASMLDERFSALGGLPARQAIAPPPPKRSIRSSVLHPDVILMGLTMIIVLFVLAAWLA